MSIKIENGGGALSLSEREMRRVRCCLKQLEWLAQVIDTAAMGSAGFWARGDFFSRSKIHLMIKKRTHDNMHFICQR